MPLQTKMRLKRRHDQLEVMVLVKHPMHAALSDQNSTRQLANYIDHLYFELNGAIVAEARMGPGVAENPLTSILLSHTKPGDQIRVRWVDNQGKQDSQFKLVK